MSNDLLKSQLSTLERKLNLLLSEFGSVRKEKTLLKAENEELKTLLKVKDDQISSFQNKIKISKIVNGIEATDEGASELKKKIDVYIKEIDRCIAHLSK
ncbi:MAG: hypothetical protein AAF519_06660 [Bacteroidota bacterium]